MDEEFNRIFNLYNKDIYRLIYSYTLNKQESKDLLQETLIKLYKNIYKLPKDDIQVKKWLIRVATNTCKDHFRTFWKSKIVVLDYNKNDIGYKQSFNIELSKSEINDIWAEILNNKRKRLILKPAYVITIIVCIIAIGTLTVSANNIIKHFKVMISEDGTHKKALSDAKIDIDYNSDILKESNYYSHEDISNLLDLKILKNEKINTNLFQLTSLESRDNRIAKAIFWNINDDYSNIMATNIGFGFEINTKYSDSDSLLSVSGITDIEYYYIKSLDTEAVIISAKGNAGPLLSNFAYNNIIYSIELAKPFYNIDDLHNILDSFIITK